ncbi:hypothetical protein ONA70_25700 [Micromonospora yasonensis]|uniref:hypothetical protein n=1 Tax=Micromonospora yasonensis TaxID=1128667 RepID=UPI0022305933|nr:hypothetical protein [Micromonospora yasonensis]MCW3843504.1 hypothetical protein [Micromonospora yasonensis]
MTRDVVELRVHGVAGVRAEALLDHPVVVRVAGDPSAGFYRPRPGFGVTTGPAGVTIEAYQWRNLTVGTVARTVVLLFLLPFMFSNLAAWMRPPAGGGGIVKALCRLLGATITIMFVLAAIGVFLDLIGWQCVTFRPCTAGRGYLGWLAELPVGPRLVVLAVLPAAFIRLLWWIGSRSARAYEQFQAPYGTSGAPPGDRLDADGFWHGEVLVGWLRSIHVAIAYFTLDLTVLVALTARDRSVLGVALLAATVLLLAACLVLLCLPALNAPHTGPDLTRPVIRPLRVAVAAVTVLTAAYAVLPRVPVPAGGAMPGFALTVNAVILGQAALLLALAAVAIWQQRGAPPAARAFFRGLGAPVFGAISAGLSATFTAGIVYRAADVLDRGAIPGPEHPPPPGAPPLDPPLAYRWDALGALVTVLLVTVVGLYVSRFSRARRERLAARICEEDFPDVPPEAVSRLRVVCRTISRSRLAEQFSPLLIVYFVLAFLSLAFTALDLAEIGPTQLVQELGGHRRPFVGIAAYLTDAGTFSIGFIVFGLVMIGVLAYVSPDVRRAAGVLWDLGSFFPRTTHPFAPPCYAERAVPELARRVSALCREQKVLLSGHSHGAALAAAAILQLPPETLRRVALLTYGSPLRRLYGHLMPAYFGDDAMREIGERIGWRWRNLWRNTDPVGGGIFSTHRPGDPPAVSGPAGQVDVRLRDPRSVTIPPLDTVPPPIEAHWPYHTDPRYAAAVAELADSLDQAG